MKKNESTLTDLVSSNFLKYHKWNERNDTKPPYLVLSRAWTGLLLLTQATQKSHKLTNTIVDIARTLDPIMDKIDVHSREKYNHLLDYNDYIHNRDYDKEEFVNRIVMVYSPLEYILHWYNESDQETPFDLNEYARLCGILKKHAEQNFSKSIWI